MIDRFITIGRFMQIPPMALRYGVVMTLTVVVTIFGTRKYMQASEGFAAMTQVADTQTKILEELKLLRLQNDSLKHEQAALRLEWHGENDAIATVMERSFDDIISLLRDAAKGNQELLKEIADKEAHIKELFEDKIKLEVQLRKKRPPPVYKGRIASEEIEY